MAWHTDIPVGQLLGAGLYTPSEAGSYIGVSSQQMLRWLHGTEKVEPVVDAQFSGHREVISFLDMVQAMAIRAMRRDKGIPLQRIREGITWVKERHPDVKYPFAHRHRTFIIRTTQQIGILLPGDEPDYVMQVSGNHKGNYVHAKMLDKYLEKLEFHDEGLAARYIPVTARGRRVVLDPEIRFGQPRVEPSGYLVEALGTAYEVEGSLRKVAWWYEMDEEEVALAVRFWSRRGEAYAAAS